MLLKSWPPKPMQQLTKNDFCLTCTKLTGKINEILDLHYNYNVFPFVTKQLLMKKIVLHPLVMPLIQIKAKRFYQLAVEVICVLGLLVQRLLWQQQPWLWQSNNFVEIPLSAGIGAGKIKKSVCIFHIFWCTIRYNLPRPILN